MSSTKPPPRGDTTSATPFAGAPPLSVLLTVSGAEASPREYRLSMGKCSVGAGHDADIIIVGETISRRHAEFELVPEGVHVRDLGSRNGTFFLGHRISGLTLAPGSEVRLGNATIRVDADLETLESVRELSAERYGDLVGRSPALRRLFGVMRRLEGALVNVLIEGPSGTGKELFARALHEHSAVSDGPFVPLNCGALDRQLARSELCGHRKGAFTGADVTRPGAFEAAHQGTLFLDEVGELPIDVQPILLRVLETGSVARIGETEQRPVKVRIVAATNRNLRSDVKAGRFREDLYYRLVVVRLEVPPLSERPEDIEPLAQHFATTAGLGILPRELIQQLQAQTWPGNVRELRNALDAYAAVGAWDASNEPHDAALEALLERTVRVDQSFGEQKARLFELFTSVYLRKLLRKTGGNQSEAARVSGLNRSYLSRLLSGMKQGKSDDGDGSSA